MVSNRPGGEKRQWNAIIPYVDDIYKQIHIEEKHIERTFIRYLMRFHRDRMDCSFLYDDSVIKLNVPVQKQVRQYFISID